VTRFPSQQDRFPLFVITFLIKTFPEVVGINLDIAVLVDIFFDFTYFFLSPP